jgi:hypothetical protein
MSQLLNDKKFFKRRSSGGGRDPSEQSDLAEVAFKHRLIGKNKPPSAALIERRGLSRRI